MADRTVSVALQLKIAGYTAKLQQATQKTKQFGTDLNAQARKNKAAFDGMATTLAGVGAAAAVGVGLAVKKFADFDKAMSNVRAATHESAGNMQLLRDAALDAGKRTAFSATEAAAAIENLAKAGVTTADILGGGLNGALDLAAAGQLDVAQAAETAATAMTQFKLSGKDVPHIADLLAAAAGKAQGEVTDMAQALNQSGLVAAQMGLSIEETTGTLAAFASAGLLGSDAGTSFKTMLLRLANPSKEAAEIMEELGIHAYDAQGAFVGITPLAEQLKGKLGSLSQQQRDSALATIFGSDAIRAANVLYQQGAKGITNWTTKVNDAGFAAETAAIKQDNLRGDLEKLGGSFETALIKIGKGGDGIARDFTRGITAAVDKFGELPPAAQQAGLAIGGVAAVGGLGAAGVLKAASAAGELRESWQNLGRTGKTLTLSMGAVGVALTAAVVLYGAFTKKNEEAERKADDLRSTLDEQTGAITGNTRAYVANSLAQNGLAQKAKDLGLNLSQVTDAALGNDQALRAVTSALDAVIEANTTTGAVGTRVTKVVNEEGQAAAQLKTELLGTSGALTEAQRTQKLAAEGAKTHQTAQQKQAGAVKLSNQEIQKQVAELEKLNAAALSAAGGALDLRSAQNQYYESLSDVNDALKENGRATSVTTKEGRANREAVDAIAKAANDYTESMLQNGRSNQSAAKFAEEARKAFVKKATQLGYTKAQAEALSKSLIAVPKTVTTKVTNTAPAAKAQAVDYKKNGLNTLPATKTTGVSVTGIPTAKKNVSDFVAEIQRQFAGIPDEPIDVKVGLKYESIIRKQTTGSGTGGRAPGWAAGGPVFGAGTATSDSIHALLSNGEHVWTAREVAAAGGHDAVEEMRRSVLGFAQGGGVDLGARVPTKRLPGLAAAIGADVDQLGTDLAGRIAAAYAAQGGPALSFARSQVGKPYVWGGVGPGGYDCSGFMSAITNVILGRSPYSRLFATGSFPTSMFAPGFGRFAIGSFRGNPGHMAGTLAGTNVESRGGQGVVVGPAARGAGNSLFGGNVWHLKGFAQGGAVNGDPPFDFLSPRGKSFKGEDLREALARGPLVRDSGGPLPTGMSLVYNGTGRSEWITPMAKGGPVNPGKPPESWRLFERTMELLANERMIALLAKTRGLIMKHEDGSAVFSDGTQWDPEEKRLRKASIETMRRELEARKKIVDRIGVMSTAFEKARTQVGKTVDRIQSLVAQRNEFVGQSTSSFTGSLFGSGTSVDDLKTRLDARTNDAANFQKNLQKLGGLRQFVNPSLLKELTLSSDYGAAQELAQMTPAQLLAISKSYVASQKATASLGSFVGNAAYGKQISQAQMQLMQEVAVANGIKKGIENATLRIVSSKRAIFTRVGG